MTDAFNSTKSVAFLDHVFDERSQGTVACISSVATDRPAQKPELKYLDALIGRWTTQGKLYDTPYNQAGVITIAMTCELSAYNGYMICDHVFNGPAGKRNDLTVYTYNQVDNSYKFYSVDQTGAPRTVPLTIEGDIWTYNSEMEKDGKKILIKTINDFSKPDIVVWNTKFSADAGAHWTLMNEGVDTKSSLRNPLTGSHHVALVAELVATSNQANSW